MSRFVLTAQLQLQAPTNVGQVVQQIQNQLNNVRVNVQVQGAQQATRQIDNVTNATNQATNAANALGRSFGLSIKRFAAFSIATRAVSLFTTGLSNAIKEAISFERELLKISQVTGKSMRQLRDLTDTITRLSTSLGVSSTSILSVSRILSQAGLSANETKIALDALAKSQLAPTFDDITETAEGAVAIFNQFRLGAEALEAQLGAINAVAGRFAVEAGDLIGVVRRVGGVFKAAGGELNELIALFTSVRATTRESAESIATGLRTIFTRIQRPKTIEFLRQYGVELLDLEGKFVGPFEATRRLSEALAGLEQGDITFIKIAEELGGFRQIGKVIPLLQQFRVAQEAYAVAQGGANSLSEDAAKAQAALAIRITKVKEEFLGLIRSISESTSFQLFANTALNLASALIKLADALKPVIPLLAAFSAIKLASGFGGFMRGVSGGLRTPRGFATGGLVPGSGNRDTVPAMLTPGEFVIRKSSVAKLGAGNLAAMNENRYAAGGQVVLRVRPNKFGGMFLSPPTEGDSTINSPQGRTVAPAYSRSLIEKLQLTGRGGLGAPGPLFQTSAKRPVPGQPGMETRQPAPLTPDANGKLAGVYTTPKPLGRQGLVKPTSAFASFLSKQGVKGASNSINLKDPTIKSLLAQFTAQKRKIATVPNKIANVKIAADSGSIPSLVANTTDMNVGLQDEVTQIAYTGMKNMVSSVLNSSTLTSKIGPKRLKKIRPNIKKSVAKLFNNDPKGKINSARAAIEGYLFEGIIGGITGKFPESSSAFFDFMYPGRGDVEGWTDLFGPQGAAKISLLTAADAKRSASSRNKEAIVDKAGKYLATTVNPSLLSEFVTVDPIVKKKALGGLIQKFATGGAVGTDTVPALLTPGEFVINRSSAQNIGYGSLNRMNKVGKYAKGGVVQKFAKGTSGTGVSSGGRSMDMFGGLGGSITLVTASLQAMLPPIDENSSAMDKVANNLLSMATAIGAAIFALQAFGVSLSLQSAKSFFGRGKGSAGDLFGGYQKGGRRAGTGFTEGFNLVGQRSRRANILRQARASAGTNATLKSNIRTRNNAERLARPGALTGRAGAFFGRAASRGGVLGKAAGGLAKIFGSFGSVLGPLIAPLASLAGPLLLIAGAGALLGGVIKGFRDLEGRLNDAIKAEDTATAQRLATSKALEDSAGGLIAGLASLGGPGLEESFLRFFSLFGGPSVASVKANVNAQIESAKAQKSLKETADKASEAMKEFEAGNISAAEAVRAAAASSAQVSQSRLATEAANKANTAQRSEGGFAVARNIFTLGGVLGETAGTRNRRIEQENQQRTDQQKQLEQEQLKVAQPAINALGRQIAATGGGIEEFRAQLKALGFTDDFIRRNEKVLTDSFNNIAKEAERTKKAFDAMNLGFQSIAAVSGALTVSMDNYLASQEAGYIGLNNTIAMLEASVTSAAQGISDADFNAALGSASDGLRKLGASQGDIEKFEQNLGAINTAQKFFAKASEETRNELKAELERGAKGTGGLTRSKFAEILAGQLDGVAPEVRDRIKDALENADIDPKDMEKLLAGDLSVLDKVLKDLGDTTLNQVIGPLKELAKYEQQLVNLAKKRYDAENKVVEAAKNLVEAQMEAAEIIAKYGGAAFTPEMRAQGVLAQANIEGQAAGVTPFVTGSAAEFNARSAQIRRGLGTIGGVRFGAAANNTGDKKRLEGRSGAALAEQERRLLNLAKSEYETAKKLISIKEQELKLISEKNRLEKSSIEALVTGDIAKFFEKQAAVGATASIALGSTRLQSAYGADALGLAATDIKRQQEAGVTEIYGQQVGGSGGLAERAYGAALSARGVSDGTALGMAQVAAGTTAEEESLKREIRSLATTLPNYAAIQLQAAEQDLQVANIQMLAAEMQLEAAKKRVRERAQVPQRAPGQPGGPPEQQGNPLSNIDLGANPTGLVTGAAFGGLAGAALGSLLGMPILGALAGATIGGGIGAAFNKGGVVYANNGMFVPRGTDTVPAMLTPGEFVVRRAAVQRGNNLAILQSMNKGQSGVSTSGAVAMADGGVVYARRGGRIFRGNNSNQSSESVGINPETVNKLSETLTQFNSAFSSFTGALTTFNSTLSSNIDKLNNTTFNVKLDATNINVNLNGGSFLAKLKDDISSELMKQVALEISNYGVGQDGKLRKNSGTLTT